MFSYWIKNRSLFTVLASIILVILICLVFINPNIQIYGENRLATNVYSDSEIDFDIPSPTPEQLTEIAKLDFIDEVFGYYYTETNVTVNNKNIKTKLLFSDCMDSINFTMYNDTRLIESSSNVYSNSIYIDYEFAKKNNVSLGDTILFNNIEFQVSKIYETNTYYSSAVFAPLVGAQKDFILSRSKAYSGAYLKVNDLAKAENYLKSYKPLGRLKDRDSFSTEEAYQNHYDSWNSANYYNEITNFNDKLQNANVKTGINNIVGYLLFVAIIVAINIVLFFRKSEIKYFKSKKDKKSIKKYYIINEITFVIVSIVITNIMFISSLNNPIYIPNTIIIEGYVGIYISIISTLIINTIIDVIIYKNKIIN